MPSISREYHAHAGNYTPGGNSHEYIAVHNTGNTASALNEAKYAQNNRHDSSYHYVLDGSGTIYQTLDHSDTAWSVGAWKGNTQYIRNNQTINIEVASNGTQFTQAEEHELAWLVQRLMATFGINPDHVVRHYDCQGGPKGRKDCPAYYSGANNSAWIALHKKITTKEDEEMNITVKSPAAARVGDAVVYRALPECKFNYAWAEGDGWDNWGSTMKGGKPATSAPEGAFIPTKPGTYRLWIDCILPDGTSITTPSQTIVVTDEAVLNAVVEAQE